MPVKKNVVQGRNNQFLFNSPSLSLLFVVVAIAPVKIKSNRTTKVGEDEKMILNIIKKQVIALIMIKNRGRLSKPSQQKRDLNNGTIIPFIFDKWVD